MKNNKSLFMACLQIHIQDLSFYYRLLAVEKCLDKSLGYII